MTGRRRCLRHGACALWCFLRPCGAQTTWLNDWIQRRIEDYSFQETIDFAVLKNEYGESKQLRGTYGSFESIEYHLTFDMATELSMVERTARGGMPIFLDVKVPSVARSL